MHRARLAAPVAVALALGVSLAPSSVFAANTLQVGPGKTYAKPCDAIAAAQAGDTIEVDAAGTYTGDTCAWTTDGLTVRGVNGRAKIDLTGVTPAQQNPTLKKFGVVEAVATAISRGWGRRSPKKHRHTRAACDIDVGVPRAVGTRHVPAHDEAS